MSKSTRIPIDKYYEGDDQHIYYKNKAIPGADPKTFQVLSDETPYFAKDKNQVYGNGLMREGVTIVRGADPETFVGGDWNSYASDKDYLYQYNSHFTEVSNDRLYRYLVYNSNDRKRYTPMQLFEKNKKFFYKKYPKIIGWWHPKYPTPWPKPIIVKASRDSVFNPVIKTYKKHVFYMTHFSFGSITMHDEVYAPYLIKGADQKTIKQLDEWYSKDKTQVYCRWSVLEGADPKTFTSLKYGLAKDKNQVYFNGFVVKDADPKTIKLAVKPAELSGRRLLDVDLVVDTHHVYAPDMYRIGPYDGYANQLRVVPTIDPKTLQVFTQAWAVDKKHVLRWGKVEKKIDRKTFEHLFFTKVRDFAKDKHHLYQAYGQKSIIKGIDGKTFQVLNKYWGKDKKSVYSFITERVLPSIDAKTFKLTNEIGGAEDKNHVYTIEHGHTLKKTKKK